jgi:hypothetical protein
VINDMQAGTIKFLPISQSNMHVSCGYLFFINSAKVDFPEFFTPKIIAEFLFVKITSGNYTKGSKVSENYIALLVVIKAC